MAQITAQQDPWGSRAALQTKLPASSTALVIRLQVQDFLFSLLEVVSPASSPGDIQNTTGHSHEQCDVTDAALSRGLN